MKKYTLIAIILFASAVAYSQTADAVLNKRLANYMAWSKGMKIDLLLDYMYPRIFEIAKKEQLKEVLEKAYNNQDFEIKLDSISLGEVQPISRFSKGSFTRFGYFVKMSMKPVSDEYKDKTDLLLQSFKTSFGEDNVAYDEATATFLITQTKEALAIKDNYSKNVWTMIGLEKNPGINYILPAEIKKKYQIE